jgi:AcrR family transcriptional regulator
VIGVDRERRLGPRAARARETRQRILDAAGRLFVERGYLPTTMRAIAQEARVAIPTLYLSFGSKAGVLAATLDTTIVGDDAPVPVLDRPWVQELRAEEDGARAVTLLCEGIGQSLQRVAPLYATMRAATGDADVAALLERGQQRRYLTERQLVALLAQKPGFNLQLDELRAADIIYGLLSEELYLLLCGKRGWTAEAWLAWVTATLSGQLFPGRRPRSET